MVICKVQRTTARKQYRVIVVNDPMNSHYLVDDVFSIGEKYLKLYNMESQFKGYGYGNTKYNFIPFVKETDTGAGVREDIAEHENIWRDYNKKTWTTFRSISKLKVVIWGKVQFVKHYQNLMF